MMRSPVVTLSSIFQQLPGDHHPLYLARAFTDSAELHVTVELFCGIVLNKAVSAMDLYAFIGTLYGDFAGEEFSHR